MSRSSAVHINNRLMLWSLKEWDLKKRRSRNSIHSLRWAWSLTLATNALKVISTAVLSSPIYCLRKARNIAETSQRNPRTAISSSIGRSLVIHKLHQVKGISHAFQLCRSRAARLHIKSVLISGQTSYCHELRPSPSVCLIYVRSCLFKSRQLIESNCSLSFPRLRMASSTS